MSAEPIEIEMVPGNSGFPITLKVHPLVVTDVHEISPGETFRAEWTWPPNGKPTKLRWVLVEDVT